MKPKTEDWKRIRFVPITIGECKVTKQVYENRDGEQVGEIYLYDMQEFETKQALLDYLESK